MKRIFTGLLLAGLFVALLSGVALAASEQPKPEGELIPNASFIGNAYFQVWQHSNGVWQDTNKDGSPDKPGQVKTWQYKAALPSVPAGWTITGVRVRYLANNNWNKTVYTQYGGYQGLSFEDFDKNQILPYAAAQGEEGQVWAELSDSGYTIHYDGIRLAIAAGVSDVTQARKGAMDLKDSKMRAILQSLSIPMNLPAGSSFASMAAGYNYWVPYIVEFYGTRQQAKPKSPNFAVSIDPGTPVVNGAHVAEVGATYTATVKFDAGDSVTGEDGPPYDVVAAGMHQVANTWWPTSLQYVSGDGQITSQAGLEPEIPIIPGDVTVHMVTFNSDNNEIAAQFNWTAQQDTKAVGANINLSYPDGDPLPYTLSFYAENGGYDDNMVIVPITVQLPDLYVKAINPGTSETEPNKSYSGTVTYGLKAGYPKSVTARLGLTHNGFAVSSVDGNTIDLAPGEAKTLPFSFTGQTVDSVLEARIWPESGDDKDWSDNTLKVTVPVNKTGELLALLDLNNMKFEQTVGTTQTIKAKLMNYGDEDESTIAVWRVNGSDVKTVNVTIPAGGNVITSYDFTMPDAATSTKFNIEVEVNPNRNKPPGEGIWSNNKSSIPVVSYKEEKADGELGPGWFTR